MIQTDRATRALRLLLVVSPLTVGGAAVAAAESRPDKEVPKSAGCAVAEPEPSGENPEIVQWGAFQKALQTVHRETRASNLLAQVRAYRRLSDEFGDQNPDFEEILASFLSWKLSAVGRYDEAHRVFDEGSPVERASAEEALVHRASLEGFEPIDAVAALAVLRDCESLSINTTEELSMVEDEMRRLGYG